MGICSPLTERQITLMFSAFAHDYLIVPAVQSLKKSIVKYQDIFEDATESKSVGDKCKIKGCIY